MPIAKTSRNKQILKDWVENDLTIAQIADKYGIRWPTAKQYVVREYKRYMENKENYFKEEKV